MTLSVALVQLDATDDVDGNIERATALADEAARGGARLVALPEYLQYRGPDDGFRASARPIPGEHTDAFVAVARRHGAWILVGSLAEQTDDPQRPPTPASSSTRTATSPRPTARSTSSTSRSTRARPTPNPRASPPATEP